MLQNIRQLEQVMATSSEVVVDVLCAADENYAKSLCVTLRTAAESLRADRQLRVYLLDGGISETSWGRICHSLKEFSVDIVRIKPDGSRVSDLLTSHHISHTAYYRLLASEWLPDSVEKVIYLDSDLLIKGDLAELWELEKSDHYCWAVPDIACPHIDAKVANVNFKKSSPYLASLSPVRNYRELGIDGKAPYFNSGVMVMYLDQWRQDNVSSKLLACLRDNKEFVWCWDQYALNVVFAGRWGKLPLKWNQGAHAFEFPSLDHVPVNQDEFVEMLSNPAVIHYTTEWKPWDAVSAHPADELFFEKLDDTAWKGWRPEKARRSLKQNWDSFCVAFCKQWIINYRKLANCFLK